MSQLTTEQVLLLNNLMYLGGNAPVENFEGQTVADMVNSVDVSKLNSDKGLTSDNEIKQIINAVKSDPELCSMKIASTHTDNAAGGGGGKSVVFLNESSKEAVVTFRGTANNEWKDNFYGGYQSDTAQQKNALDWYKQTYEDNNLGDYYVTVTGHSKGGNKAKYVTVLDDSVDRCLSFDGQGFSDEFMEKYESQIGVNQGKIQNHNVDKDYVNILLNDIGETTYYEGQHYGEGKLAEAHCADTLLKFNEDGSVSMVVNPDGQYQPMKDLDNFMNGYLRTLGPEDKKKTLEFFAEAVNAAMDKNTTADELKAILMDPKHEGAITNLLAYTVVYAEENPEMAKNVKNILSELGFEQYTEYVDKVQDVLEMKFDLGVLGTYSMTEVANFLGGVVSGVLAAGDWIRDLVLNKIMEKTGLSKEEAEKLLNIILLTTVKLDDVEINNNGSDIKVKDTSFGGVGYIKEDSGALLGTAEVFRTSANNAQNLLDEFESAMKGIKFSALELLGFKSLIVTAFNRIIRAYGNLGGALEDSAMQYDRTEQGNVDRFV